MQVAKTTGVKRKLVQIGSSTPLLLKEPGFFPSTSQTLIFSTCGGVQRVPASACAGRAV